MTLIILIIAIVVASFIGFGLFQARELTNIHITKQVAVNGNSEEVFNMVRYLANFPKWSPFLAEDPAQKYEVKGSDGQIGAQYHWEGNKGKDLGYQEIVQLNAPHFVGMQCDIQKPFQAKPTFDYSFANNANGVTITQDFKLQSGLVDAFFMWLFGARKEMAATNERGLSLLKQAVEK
ncbi:MAG: SRPBCC family protein [Chitinophagales bacterium]